MKHKLESRFPGDDKLRYEDDTTLMVKSKEPLDEGEKGDKEAGFQKTKIMASGPITS